MILFNAMTKPNKTPIIKNALYELAIYLKEFNIIDVWQNRLRELPVHGTTGSTTVMSCS